jgi:hypothetical protein
VKLYSGPLSLFTAKVRIALDEKALAYERVEVGWSLAARYEPHHPDVVALNPKRQVPVLVDGDVVVYDSTIVLEYLEDRYPAPPLFPRDAIARARCRQLEAAADELWFPAIWDLIEGVFYPHPEAGARRRGAQHSRHYEGPKKSSRAGSSVWRVQLHRHVHHGECGATPGPSDAHTTREWLAHTRARRAPRESDGRLRRESWQRTAT